MAAGKEINRLRGKAVSAAKVAGLIGVNADRLRKWEERDTDPSDTGDIQKVEDYFGCTLSELKNIEEFEFVKKPMTTKSSDLVSELKDRLIASQESEIKLLKERQQSETRLIQVEERLKIVVEILSDLKDRELSHTPSASSQKSIGEIDLQIKGVNKNENSSRRAGHK
jgi:transcriptional regulator with XRE-family HTH domain